MAGTCGDDDRFKDLFAGRNGSVLGDMLSLIHI